MTSNDPDSRSNGGNVPSAPEEDEKIKPSLSRADRQGSHASKGKEAAATAAPAPKKPGRLAKMGFTPIDLPTFLIMVKGAVAPTIGIAIYQHAAVAHYFTTLGYLVGIISVLCLSILPRGKFLQNVVLNVIFVCAGAAMGLLILWSSLQARLHTQTGPSIDPVTRRPTYNSSQSAVSAVWLFVSIWFVNVLRAMYPTLNVPVILYSILTSISCTFSPQMTSNAAFESVIRRILVAMLAAMGLATGASLLVFPLPSRKVTYGQMRAALTLMRGAVRQEKAYLQSLENEDMFAEPVARVGTGLLQRIKSRRLEKKASKASKNGEPPVPPPAPKMQMNNRAEAEQVKQTIASLRQLSGKMQADLPFAKRDFAWGKLDGGDVKMLFYHLRSCLIPIIGLSTVIDIFQRIAERRGWNTDRDTPADVVEEKNAEKRIWNEIMKQLHEPLETLSEALDQGLEHAGLVLEILPKPKKKKKADAAADVEAKGDAVQPGDPGFARLLEEKAKSFEAVKVDILASWASQRGLAFDESAAAAAGADLETMPSYPSRGNRHQRDQFQLFLLLYIEKLMTEIGDSVRGFVAFADQKAADGTMAQNRLIIPKYRRIKKWVSSIFSSSEGESTESNDLLDAANIVYMGDSFATKKKDPEHLPPANAWERLGEGVRAFSKFFSSEASMFGVRVACATMTIGIVNFLEPTQQFFQQQRGVWAMIIIAIGMTQSSGQSIQGFFCRVGGTVVSMVLSLVNWYIVGERVPGILVFLFVFLVFEHYFLLKFPQFTPAVMICMVTHVMIIGYELQVVKLGVAASEASGQVYYPIYTLAPYRLACVAAGCAVAFFWTRTWIRRDLSATLYLLANYFSVIDESLKSKLHGTGGDPRHKRSPTNRLKKHRQLLLGKLLLLLPSLKLHADWQRWEPTLGGAFPRAVYEDIIKRATRITSYLTLMAHTVGYSPPGKEGPAETERPDRAWIDALAELMADVVPTKRGIVCTLTLLSHSLQTGHSLPPNMPLPRPFALTRRLGILAKRRHRRQRRGSDEISLGSGSSDSDDSSSSDDSDREEETNTNQASPSSTTATATVPQGGPFGLLDAKNMAETGYAEFAVLQVCSSLICDDLEDLVRDVSKLVGVVDFSFRVEGSSSTVSSGSTTDGSQQGGGGRKGKRD
ncbi:hypothetical protein PG991_008317 [Apiospora marii]|uniref:ER transporter 6TM N-terminal domain-containing protein n=1 Tax=Apiospora marii TaxID=335849 RepID=A0ABR1RRQ6_9PEZI